MQVRYNFGLHVFIMPKRKLCPLHVSMEPWGCSFTTLINIKYDNLLGRKDTFELGTLGKLIYYINKYQILEPFE